MNPDIANVINYWERRQQEGLKYFPPHCRSSVKASISKAADRLRKRKWDRKHLNQTYQEFYHYINMTIEVEIYNHEIYKLLEKEIPKIPSVGVKRKRLLLYDFYLPNTQNIRATTADNWAHQVKRIMLYPDMVMQDKQNLSNLPQWNISALKAMRTYIKEFWPGDVKSEIEKDWKLMRHRRIVMLPEAQSQK